MQTSTELQTAIDAAKKGAKVALKYFQTSLEIKIKEDNSYVTIADVRTEEAIKKTILKVYPKAKFVAEESGGDTKEKDFWLIDPIDGTRVFTHGIRQWSILISHNKNNEIIQGVCYIPTQDILLSAEKNKGSYLNQNLVRVSQTKDLKNAFGSFGSITRFKTVDPIMKLKNMNISMRSYEHAYALCLLASGNFDFVIDSYGTPWDYAPFIPIVHEAGGKITDFEGIPWNLDSKNLLATNGLLHEEIVKIINTK